MGVVLVGPVTVKFPVVKDPEFRKDLRAGIQGKVLEVAEDGKKVKIQADVMHHGAPAVFVDWIMSKNLRPFKEEDTTPLKSNPVPEVICQGHPTDKSCEWVEDWTSLIEDQGPKARLDYIKGLTSMAMGLVQQHMPQYSEKDLGVIHRQNHHGAKSTEVWTLRTFAPGQLMFSPVTNELKTRMFTHNTCVHVNLGREAIPDNKLLALDGRGKTHLSHEIKREHVPVSTGSLFWAIQRTSNAFDANLSLVRCTLTFPEIKLTIPGQTTHNPNIPKSTCPGIPILKNMQTAPAHMRLVTIHDQVVALATEQEIAKRKADRITAEVEHSKTAKNS